MPTGTQLDFDGIDSVEHATWRNHRDVMRLVDADAIRYRGCIGLAAVIDTQTTDSWADRIGKKFVPDATLRWASLVDIPPENFRVGRKAREIHWATVRPTTVQYGVPRLAFGSETDAFDFRSFPYDPVEVPGPAGPVTHVPPKDTLRPSLHPQLFRVFNALEWAMTSTAFHFRRAWAAGREQFCEHLGLRHGPDTKALLFGDGVYDGVARPVAWMPQAYLGFPEETLPELFDRSTRPGMIGPGGGSERVVYKDSLKEAFVDALGTNLGHRAEFDGRVEQVVQHQFAGCPCIAVTLVSDRGVRETLRFHYDARLRHRVGAGFKRGDLIADERFASQLPPDWYDRSPVTRWERWLERIIPGRVEILLRLWFERQAVRLVDGLVHLPAAVSSVAAFSTADDAALVWDVKDSLDYFNGDCDAMIFPTIQISAWDQLRGQLPGDVTYDFTPNDPRFETMQARRQRVDHLRAVDDRRREQIRVERPPAPAAQSPEQPPVSVRELSDDELARQAFSSLEHAIERRRRLKQFAGMGPR